MFMIEQKQAQGKVAEAWQESSESTETIQSEKDAEEENRPPSILKKISNFQPPMLSPVPEGKPQHVNPSL